jgi:hypothetical protein
MTGMKEKQAINTVGSPLAPKDETGRGGYAIPLLYGAGMAAMRFLPAAYRGFKAARAYKPFSQNLGIMSRAKDLFTPKKGLGLQMGAPGEGAGFRVGSLLRSNPLSLGLPVASMGLEAGTKAVKGIAQATPDLLKSYANTIIPFADPFTVGEKGDDIKTTGEGEIKRGGKTTNVGEVGTGGTGDSKSDAEKKQINEARIEENKQKYYKLMGIDKMNKEATYDSLIDASKIIAEKGGDLKGAIKSGDLQSSLISAISKNLDKSTDLKKQIDAAVLKAEIQKDINLTKPSAFAEQVAYLRNNPNDPLARKLSGLTSVADNLAAVKTAELTSDLVQRLVESKGTDVSGTVKDDKYQKWEKNNEGKDEIDYIQENLKGIEPGVYIINKKAIQIKDGVATEVDLDSIIG